jgi:hypothetical protein
LGSEIDPSFSESNYDLAMAAVKGNNGDLVATGPHSSLSCRCD